MPLADTKTAASTMEYWRNKNPKCPHCDAICDVSNNEWWQLYDTQESQHTVECPFCDREFVVEVHCEFSFSTEDQPESLATQEAKDQS